jgi:ribosomal protein L32E
MNNLKLNVLKQTCVAFQGNKSGNYKQLKESWRHKHSGYNAQKKKNNKVNKIKNGEHFNIPI